MRKRNCDKLFDNILWYTIYLLPLIVALLIYRSPEYFNYIYEDLGYGPTSFGAVFYEVMWDMGFLVDTGNVGDSLYTVLEQFGLTGQQVWFAQYFFYLVIAHIMHIMVDFLLFIPRLCHKWMNTLTQGD